MDTSSGLSVVVAERPATPCATTGSAPAPLAVGVHSLRELVDQAVAEAEAEAIGRALTAARGNKSLAARILQTNYTTLHAKMKRFHISAHEFRPS